MFSEALLKELHLLTRDGQLNQDAKRKLKQIEHLIQFLKPMVDELGLSERPYSVVDIGSGKSYLGLIMKESLLAEQTRAHLVGLEAREELNKKAIEIAKSQKLGRCHFVTTQARDYGAAPAPVGLVVALHACDRATDEAIVFGLQHSTQHFALVPCCQAELAANFDVDKVGSSLRSLMRFPLHRRSFGAHLTNVLRMLYLEAHGYKVRVTEFTGFEHTQKNELILATRHQRSNSAAWKAYQSLVEEIGVEPQVLKDHSSRAVHS